jgi:PAS domain S-box-containing protein
MEKEPKQIFLDFSNSQHTKKLVELISKRLSFLHISEKFNSDWISNKEQSFLLLSDKINNGLCIKSHLSSCVYIGELNDDLKIKAIQSGIVYFIDSLEKEGEIIALIETLLKFQNSQNRLNHELHQTKENLSKGELIASYGHWTINLNDSKVSLSEGAKRIYGQTKNQFSLDEIRSFHIITNSDSIEDILNKLKIPNESVELRYSLRRPADNKILHIHSISELDEENGYIFGVIKDITDYSEIAFSLQETKNNLKRSEKIAQIGSYTCDFEKNQWESNSIFNSIFGIEKTFIQSIKNWIQLVHPNDRKLMKTHIRDLLSGKISKYDMEYRIFKKNNHEIAWIHGLGEIKFSENGKPTKLYGTARDITNDKVVLEEHIKLNKVYNLISELNNLILRTNSIQSLLNNICKLIVNYGNYSLCWIGENDESVNYIRPIVHEGFESGFMSLVSEFRLGLGSSERALREEKTIVCNDIHLCECSSDWKEETLSRNFKSSISIPIHINGHLKFMISLYSNEINSFSNPIEIELLEIIVKNISHVMEGMINEEENSRIKLALIESEKKFSKTFYLNPAAAGLSNIETGMYVEVNDAFVNLLGYQKEELLGKTAMELGILSNEMRTEILKNVDENGHLKNIESHLVAKDGRMKYVLLSSENIILDTKKYRYTVVQDLTDRKKAEEEIKQNDLRLESLLRISQLNTDSIQELLDITLLEAIKLSESKIGFIYFYNENQKEFEISSITNELGFIENDNRNKEKIPLSKTNFWTESIRNKAPFIFNEPYPQKSFPIEIKQIERYISIPIIREDKIVGILGLANKSTDYSLFDIRQLGIMMETVWNYIDLKRADLKIKQLFKAVEQSPVSIIITNTSGAIEYVNPAFQLVTGYTFNEVTGKNPRFLKSGNTSSEEYLKMWETISSGKNWKGEFYNKKKNGEYFWESAVLSPIMNEKDEVINFLAVKTDITNRKNAEMYREKITADLVAQNNALQQFTYIVSHNLRAPVANMIGLSELALLETNSEEDQKTILENIHVCVEKMDEVISDLNLVLQVKEIIIEKKEYITFKDILNQVKHDLHQEIKNSRTAIIGDFNRVNGMLGIRTYINSIFNNLISNSIKYRNRNEQTIIEVSAERTKDGFELLFKDNGIGIDLIKNEDKIFGLYKRFHPNYAEGRGVGLFMVKTQVEALQGKIKFESEEMKGSRVRISFSTK